jgi:hypothetical protein
MRPEDLARLFQAMPLGAPQGFVPPADTVLPEQAVQAAPQRRPLSFGGPQRAQAPAGSVRVPLPPTRPPEFDTVAQADLPAPGAQAIMSAAQTEPPAAEGPSFLDRVMGGIRSSDGLLTSIATGLLTTPGFGQGIGAGLQAHQQGEGRRAASRLAQAEYGLKANKLAREQNAENQTAKFIQSKIPGMTSEQATALAGNTSFVNEILKGVVPPQEVYRQHTDDKGNVWNENTRTGQQTVALQAKDATGSDEGAKIRAQIEARRAEAASLGLVEGSPEWRSWVGTGKVGRENDIPAADRKVIHESEDAIPQIDSTLDTLKRARELNRKTFTGVGSAARGWLGTALPDAAVPDWVADPKAAEATREFGQIMSMEAIKSMSETLKGATTDREMARFTEILGDPTTPPDIRERTIDRMIDMAQKQQAKAQSRISEMREGTYYKRGGGAGQAPAAPQQTQTPARDPLSSARDAIAKGAPREAVISRLRASGIDPAGL